MGRYTTGGIGRDVIAGALAGAAAVWLVEQMQLSLTHTGTGAEAQGMDPAHAAAAKAQQKAGVRLGGDPRSNAAGRTVHYGVGAGLGALYGLLRGMAPSVTAGRGALYGLAAFIAGDEVGAPMLGLARGPLEYAAKDHARGALAHGLFGIITDLGTRVVSPWKDEVVIYQGAPISERIAGGRQLVEDRWGDWRERGARALDYGRERLGQMAGDVRDRLDEADLPTQWERGRRYARQFAARARDWLPEEDDVRAAAAQGQQRAQRFARNLPTRDDLADAADDGRRRVGKAAERVRQQVPDRDDVSDLADRGRQLAEEAYRGSGLSRVVRWLMG